MKHYFTTKSHIINHSIIHLYLRNVTQKPRKTIATCIHMLCVYMYIHVYIKKIFLLRKPYDKVWKLGKAKFRRNNGTGQKFFKPCRPGDYLGGFEHWPFYTHSRE